MNYEKIRLRGPQFKSVTSLEVDEFDVLLADFSFYMDRTLRYTTRGEIRQKKLVLPSSLPDFGHLLFFVLTYLKLNPLQEQHGASFDLSQESVSRWYRLCLVALNSALRKQGDMPVRNGGDFADWVKKKRMSEKIIS